jgi:outer membrane protein TolC
MSTSLYAEPPRAVVTSCALGLLVALGFAPRAAAQDAAALPRIGLGDALRGAQTAAPSVAAAQAAYALREAESDVADAAYFPVLTLRGSGGYAFDNRVYALDNRVVLPDVPRIDSESLTADANASLEWTAIDFSRGSRSDAAEAATRAEGWNASAAKRDALLLAAERFVAAAAATALVKEAELALARRSEQEQAVTDLVRAGTRSPLDLERAKIETLSASYALAAGKRDELAACAALAAAIGRPATQPVCAQPDGLGVFELELSPERALAIARSERPEPQARAALVSARREDYDAAIGARLPTVGVATSAELSYLDVREGEGIDGHQYGASAVLYVRWSGLDPTTWTQAGAADAAVALAERQWVAERHAVESEAVAAAHAVQRARIELDRAVAVQHASEVTRDAQNGRYRAGLASMLELLDTENLAQDARRARIEADRDYKLAGARLLWANGRLAALAR